MATEKINSFKDLKTWQMAYDLAVQVYGVTAKFPDSEKFGLSNQLRRATVSVASNIAEGFSRQGLKEKVQFYHMAKGSLSEVECQLLIAYGVKYLTEHDLADLQSKLLSANKLLSALARSAQKR